MKANKLTPGLNIKWEASRMMLPEHKESILQHRKELTRKPKPILEEQRIEQFSQIITDAIEWNAPVTIHLYDPYQDLIVVGKIERVDTQSKRIRVMQEEESVWIDLEEMLEIYL